MKYLAFVIAAMLAVPLPAAAKDFVQDQAGMFSQATIDALNNRISNFNAQTGKEIVVQTVPSVADGDVRSAAENAFSQQQVNGVLIFISKGDRKDYILPDRAAVQAGWWSSQTSTSIAQAMEAQFRAGDFDGGITTAVGLALNVYRSHLSSLNNGSGGYQPARSTYAQPAPRSAVHISMFWIIILVLVGFFILRSLMRAASGPRYYGGGYGPGAPGPGPGGGYGYGPGYGGWGGGGGGFFSGLLGGLGGAWLGNELFRGGQNYGGGSYGNVVDPNAGAAAPDAGGWQSDAGQADVGGGGGGDWGGGGFGGGDFGGGGGFGGGGDFGGGGGGGGW